MTQKVKLDFIITAKSVGVDQELARLNTQLNAMAKSVRGPMQVNNALRQQMQLHEANINSLKGHAAAMTTLNSVSHTFNQHLKTGNVTGREALNSFRALTGSARGYSNEIKSVAQQQLRFQSVGFQGFMKDMNGRLQGVAYTTEHFGRNLFDATGKTAAFRMQQFLAASQVQAFGKKLVKAGKDMQWSGRQITMGLTLPLALIMGGLASVANAVDKEVTKIVKVYDFGAGRTEEAINRVKDTARSLAFEVSQAYGFTAQETLKVMAEFAAQGRRGQELLRMTGETMRVAFLGDVNTEDSSRLIRMLESAADIANGINIGAPINDASIAADQATRSFQDLSDVLNRFNVLENNTVITVAELAEELPDLVGTLNSLNLSVEFGAAALTAMKEAGLNVNESQTALRVGLQRLVSPTEKAARVFQEMTGQDLNALADGAGSAEQVIVRLADTIRSLPDFNAKADVLSAIFGNRQSGRLSLLFDQIGDVNSAFTEAIETVGGFNGAIGIDRIDAYRVALEETELVQESLSGKLQRAKASFGTFAAQLGTTFLPIITAVVNVAADIVKWFDSWPSAFKIITIGILATAAAFGLVVQILGTFLNLFGNVIKFVGWLTKMKPEAMFKKMGLSAEIFASAEETLQRKMISTTEVIAAQTEATLRLQKAQASASAQMAATQGVYQGQQAVAFMGLSGAQGLAQQASKTQAATMMKWLLQEAKEQLRLTTEQIKQEQVVIKELEKQLVVKEKQLALERKTLAQLEQKLALSVQDETLAIAKADATRLEYQGRVKLEQIKLAELEASLAELSTQEKTPAVLARIEKLEAKRLVSMGAISRMQNTMLASDQAAYRIMERREKLEFELAKIRGDALNLSRIQLGTEVSELKVQLNAARIAANFDLLLKSQLTSQTAIAELEHLIGREKLNSLIIQQKELTAAEAELLIKQKELDVEKKTNIEASRLARLRGGPGRRAGIGGAALGVGFAMQSVLPNEGSGAAWGGLASAGVSGAITGMMVGGGPGAAVGLAVGLLQAIGPLKELGRQLGFLEEEAKGAMEQTKELAEGLQLPFNLNPFEGQIINPNSLYAQRQFESTDFGVKFMEDFGGNAASGGHNEEDQNKLREYLREVVPTLIFGGLTPEEITAQLQPALNAVGSDLDLTRYMFDLDEAETSLQKFARLIPPIISRTLDESDSLGTAIGQAFEMVTTAVQANRGEYAAAAAEALFSDEGLQELLARAEQAGNRAGVTLSSAAQRVIDREADLGNAGTAQEAIAQLEGQLQNLRYSSPQTSEERQQVADEIAAIEEAIRSLGTVDGSTALTDLESHTAAAAEEFEAFVRDLAAAANLEIPENLTAGWGDVLESLARSLGPTVFEEYEKNLQAARTAMLGMGAAAHVSDDALKQNAFSLALLADQAQNTAGALAEFEDDAEAMAAWDAFMSEYRSRVEAAYQEFGDALLQPFEDAIEAEQEIWDDRLEAQSDAHEEESRLFGNAQQDRMEALQETLAAELEVFDEQTEAMEQLARDGADAKLKALEDEEEAINELDRKRELAYEREKRRQEYFINLRNTSVSLAVALATGDVEQATQLRGELETTTSDYMNEQTASGIEEQRREQEVARELERQQIQDQLDAELQRIEETRAAEREAMEDTHNLKVENLQEEQRLAREVLKDRQEAEQEFLQEQREAAREAGQARMDAAKEALIYALEEVNPQTIEGWHEVVRVMNERLLATGGAVGVDQGFLGAVETAGLNASAELETDLHAAVQGAGNKISSDPEWAAYGEEMANRIASGVFGGVTLPEMIGWLQGGSNPFDPQPAPFHAPGTGPIPGSHTGGKISHLMGSSRMPGKLRPDEKPIIAQTGEFMLQRSAVQQLGVPMLEQLNQGKLPDDMYFHSGGLIGMITKAVSAPMLSLIRAMGEAGGAAMSQEGVSAFAKAFGPTPGGMADVGAGAEALEAFMAVIRQQESNNNYNVTNPIGAHGAYQFMPGTWAGAVVPALGKYANLYSSTPAEQDSVARYLMGQYFAELQSWPAVAAAWYGGLGRGRLWVQNPSHPYFDQPQGGYPTVREYINSIVAKMGVQPAVGGFGPFYGFGGGDIGPGGPAGIGDQPFAKPRDVWPDPGLMNGPASNTAAALNFIKSSWPGILSASFGMGRVNSEGQYLTNTDHNYGKAIDTMIAPLGTFPADPTTIARGWSIARWFVDNPDAFGTKYVIYRGLINQGGGGWQPYTRYGSFEKAGPTRGHYDHPHVSFLHSGGLVNPKMPSLMSGGKIMYDNTIANLHSGETVLTKPLTDELERGIRSISNSSTINVYPSAGMDEARLAQVVIHKLEARDRRRGVRPGA